MHRSRRSCFYAFSFLALQKLARQLESRPPSSASCLCLSVCFGQCLRPSLAAMLVLIRQSPPLERGASNNVSQAEFAATKQPYQKVIIICLLNLMAPGSSSLAVSISCPRELLRHAPSMES